MKSSTSLFRNTIVLLGFILLSYSTYSQTCGSTISTYPYNENFESSVGAWTQDTGDNFNWTRDSGGTPSSNTGPITGQGDNWYMYIETSSPRSPGDTANLESPCFDLTSATAANFIFWYHMFGSAIGSLYVELSTDNGSTYPNLLWSQTGQVQTSGGQAYNQVNLNMAAFVGQTVKLRFRGVRGPSWAGDIAIDNVSMTATVGSFPEIDVQGNATSIADGDSTPSTADDTDFGNVNISTTSTHTYSIHNVGAAVLTISNLGSGISITGSPFFTINTEPALNTTLGGGSSVNFSIDFTPMAAGVHTATVSIDNDDSNENPYTFVIQGNGEAPLTEGPGGVTSNLEIWLKADDGAGLADNQLVSTWIDQARSNDATVNLPGQEPTFRDNANYNVNYNPVVDFDTSYNLAPVDSDFSYDDMNGDFLQGSSGFHTQDIFMVVLPDKTINSTFGNMDFFCGDEDLSTNAEDVTGFGYGRYSVRFTNEVFSYCVGPSTGSAPYMGYGVTDNATGTDYNTVGILNARNHPTLSQQELYYNGNNVETAQNDIADFSNVNDSRYWIGRSEGYEASTDARIVEIISFSSRKNDATLTDERNRIESYLAIKYGITLGVNGTSHDYVASDGSVIWDASANSGYNYDIAGIGRDDDSDLYQKQTKSVNSSSIISMSLSNTELTNNLNSNTFTNDNEFLIWGHNGQNTNSSATSITVSLGPATITTVTDVMNRIWKINETPGDDIGTVEVSVFESDLSGLPALVGSNSYVMLVADDPAFTTNLTTVFLDPSTFNGLATREGTFDFDGTKFFTIGIAYEEIQDRHLEFDGVDNFTLVGDKVNLAGSFTASAWVKPEGSNDLSTDKTVAAKNNGTVGYKLYLTDSNNVVFSVGTTPADMITSNTQLPDDIWHHIAVTFDGTTANIYIDGVLDNSKTLTSPTPNGSKLAIGAVYIDKSNVVDYFKGGIDEIRIWDDALSLDQLHYVMNQELVRNGTVVNGSAVPNTITKNEIEIVDWSNLLAYYNMNTYIGTHLNDASGNGNRGSLAEPSQFDLEFQSSPLPYRSTTNGDWDDDSTWQNGSEQYIPGSPSIVDPNITVDWNVVEISHNITLENSTLPAANNDTRSVLGLDVTANELSIDADNGLLVTHYLKVDGMIDLVGESQLIQTQGSDLDVTSSGSLERDQQGTADVYTYNYWSSPVSLINTTSNNTSYTIPNVLRDGTNPSSPDLINFITTGYNGTNTTPIGLADYWIWKFANQPDDDYSAWQHVRSTGSMLSGEGFTLKGPGSGSISTPQNYVFVGKPNNGDISVNINAGNDYLVGNPYPSAIDAHEFLSDNPLTGGTLYFWEHWGGGSHNLQDYQGGYAQYNYSGGTGAASYGTNDPDVGTGGTPTKLPGRFIPVSQGFFVYGAATGTINFENDQRVFVREGATSTFVRLGSNNNQPTNYYEDERMKFRIGFNSYNEIHRQLLLTIDENASPDVDWGYDGEINELQMDDMFWIINDNKYVIQGIDQVNEESIIPLGISVTDEGLNYITIDHLENVPDEVEIYAHDNVLNIYHDLKQSDYEVYLTPGDYFNRFALTFLDPNTAGIGENEFDSFDIFYHTDSETILIQNPNLIDIYQLELYNILGQSIFYSETIETENYSEIKINNLVAGTYIMKLNSENGRVSKKVLVK